MPQTKSLVYSALEDGYGYAGYRRLARNMNLKSVCTRKYEKYKHTLCQQYID